MDADVVSPGDADLTDPDRTGFAMLFPNLNALEAVSVATAGVHPDAYGTGTMVVLTPRMPASTWQRTFEFMASPTGFQSVNPLPAPRRWRVFAIPPAVLSSSPAL